MLLKKEAKLKAINKQANHNIIQLLEFGEANRSSGQPLDLGVQSQNASNSGAVYAVRL